MRRAAFVGVDVAFAKAKVLPIAIASWKGDCLVPFPLRELGITPPLGAGNVATLDATRVREFAAEAAQYLLDVARILDLDLQRIAIDAPQAPALASGVRRAAELALDAAGVSCFATPSIEDFERIRGKVGVHLSTGGAESALPHANQLWMLVGFALFEELAKVAPCVEVFPQATIRAIGAGQVHKSQYGAVEAQLSAAAQFTGWPDVSQGETLHNCVWGSAHDQLDAYLSVWVAALDENHRLALGTPPHDTIWVPKTSALNEKYIAQPAQVVSSIARRVSRTPRVSTRPASSPSESLLCPACSAHTFQRWPWGWDAHAAHRCAGLSAEGEAERKAEYRARFGHMFGR